MNKFILFCAVMFTVIGSMAQESHYQTYSTSLTIIATKDGHDLQWENKQIPIVLNYKTGDFVATIKGNDFADKGAGQPMVDTAAASPDRVFTITGVFPVDNLIDQQEINAQYTVELQLTNNDNSLFETILFKMDVTKPGAGQANYRIFVLTGTLYANDLDLPAFAGMDNEITLQLFFNAFWQD